MVELFSLYSYSHASIQQLPSSVSVLPMVNDHTASKISSCSPCIAMVIAHHCLDSHRSDSRVVTRGRGLEKGHHRRDTYTSELQYLLHPVDPLDYAKYPTMRPHSFYRFSV